MTMNEIDKKKSELDTQVRDEAFSQSGLSEDFRDQWNSTFEAYNPESVKDTFWDKFSNFFGARSSADKARMQLEQARNEQLSQLVGLKREQDYNSESAKVARMRNAGLNPDLQGLGDASEASEATEPEQRPDFSALSTGADIAGKFSNALTTALGLFSGVQGLKMAGINIAKGEIENAVSSSGDFIGLIKSLWNKEQFDSYFKDDSEWNEGFVPVFKHQLKQLGVRSKRGQNALVQRLYSMFGTYAGETEKYNTFSDFIGAQDKYLHGSSSWYRDSGKDSTDASIVGALKPYNDTLHDIDVKSANFQRTYYSLISAQKFAEAENSAATFRKYCNDKKTELYQKLTKNDDMFSLLLATSLMGDSQALPMIGKGVGMFSKFL